MKFSLLDDTMAKTIDACGLTCPAPVLLVKDTVEKGADVLSVLVDNQASAENVERFLTSRGYTVSTAEKDGVYTLEAQSEGGGDSSSAQEQGPEKSTDSSDEEQKVVVLIMTDKMGNGDDELGSKLMVNYIKTLKEMGPSLWQLIFVNSGVKLAIDSSPVLDELKEYSENGTIVLACGTCLEHFKLMEKKAVGSATNMLDIVMATQAADKVITMG